MQNMVSSKNSLLRMMGCRPRSVLCQKILRWLIVVTKQEFTERVGSLKVSWVMVSLGTGCKKLVGHLKLKYILLEVQ